ncbi:M1 family metallopeptidase [Flavobacteriaceae bacterium SZ-1-7]|uniref:M1 family metallopeptidase n=1 Tax=Tamlana sedimenti TaxID=3134126 RepID=UPI003125653A
MKRFTFLLCFFVAISWGQQTDYVDFKTAKIMVAFKPDSSYVFGVAIYKFDVLKPIDSLYLDAVSMEFDNVLINEKVVDYRNSQKKIWVKNHFEANTTYELSFNFSAKPKKALYFIDWDYEDGNKQIWTQGQGKYTSNWLPSIDDMNDKIEFDLSITFDKGYEVISNGKLKKKLEPEYFTTWIYDMIQPMSSYLVALVIGKYHKKAEYSKSGIPLEMYYYPEDSLKVEPTYRYTKQMFDFLEEEIGVPYPWQNYKQVPVKDFLYAGMENTSCTIFSDSYMIDSVAFVDKNYVNVNAHELAHQWFGNLVTETSGTHHWLQEGFATYYALLAEKDIFGEDYYYWRLYEYAQELLEQDKAGGSTSLLDPKSSSTTFYKKGAWVLHILREKVGDKAFKLAVKNYLEKHQFKNAETDDFIIEVEKVSGGDLTYFKNILKDSNDDIFQDICSLMKFDITRKYINVENLDCPDGIEYYFDACKQKRDRVKLSKFSAEINSRTKVEFLNDLLNDSLMNIEKIYKKAFESKDIKLRQTIAQNLTETPSELKTDYETLLDDGSYITVEAALFNLWKNFPQERQRYLNKTKGIVGFNDKNVRMLWLTLALLTDDFEPENKSIYYNELVDYTSPKYGFEIRMGAFQYLTQIQACNDACKENLKQATKHHNWQMVKFAKSALKNLEEN